MKKSVALRLGGFIGAAGITAALIGTAVTGTGAYFSDTSDAGTITGTFGSISLTTGTAPDTDLSLAFTNILPGESQSQTVGFTNDGRNAQDVWVVFDQATIGDHRHDTDTGLINDRGRYGEVHIKGSGTPVFDSNNLNDDSTSCPPGTKLTNNGVDHYCNPLPAALKLQSALAPGQTGSMEFTYRPAPETGNGANSATPVPTFQPIAYHIVATQVGISPQETADMHF